MSLTTEWGRNLGEVRRHERICEEPSRDFWNIPGRGDAREVQNGGGRSMSLHLFFATRFFGWSHLFHRAWFCFLLCICSDLPYMARSRLVCVPVGDVLCCGTRGVPQIHDMRVAVAPGPLQNVASIPARTRVPVSTHLASICILCQVEGWKKGISCLKMFFLKYHGWGWTRSHAPRIVWI